MLFIAMRPNTNVHGTIIVAEPLRELIDLFDDCRLRIMGLLEL